MKRIFFSIAASISLFCSCSNDVQDELDKDVKIPVTFGVSAETSQTRASLTNMDNPDEPNKGFTWEDNDKITIFALGHSQGDTFSKGDKINRLESYFTGETYDSDSYYAIFPQQKSARLGEDGIHLTIPTYQIAVKNSFSKFNADGDLVDAAIQVARAGKGNQLKLNNVCAFFKITVPSDCNRVEIYAENSWKLSGPVTVGQIDNGGIKITDYGNDGESFVHLTGTEEGGTFLIAFAPALSTPAFSVHVHIGTAQVDRDFTPKGEKFAFSAGCIYNLGEVKENSDGFYFK